MPLELRDVTPEELRKLAEEKRKFNILDSWFNGPTDPKTVSLERELDEIIFDIVRRVENYRTVGDPKIDPKELVRDVIQDTIAFHPRLEVSHHKEVESSGVRYDAEGCIEVVEPYEYFNFMLKDLQDRELRIRKCVTMEFILGRIGAAPPVQRFTHRGKDLRLF